MPISRKLLRTINDYCLTARGGVEGLPDYFRLLRSWVDFDHGAYFMADGAGRLCGAYHEDHSHAAHAAEFVKRARDGTDERSPDDPPSVEAMFRTASPVPVQLICFDSRASQRSALFREVIAPIGGRHVLRFGVSVGGRPAGLLALVRGRSARGFQPAEIGRALETAQPLARLVAEPVVDDRRRQVAEGFMVLSPQGVVLQSCVEGERLWRLLGNACFLPRIDAEPLLQSICSEVGRDPLRAVRRTLNSGWGHFELLATPLRSMQDSSYGAIHLQVQQWMLLRLVHLRRMESMGLSATQKRVCIELLRNQTQTAIAEILEIRPQTAISHIRDVYNKARVGSRQELFQIFG